MENLAGSSAKDLTCCNLSVVQGCSLKWRLGKEESTSSFTQADGKIHFLTALWLGDPACYWQLYGGCSLVLEAPHGSLTHNISQKQVRAWLLASSGPAGYALAQTATKKSHKTKSWAQHPISSDI